MFLLFIFLMLCVNVEMKMCTDSLHAMLAAEFLPSIQHGASTVRKAGLLRDVVNGETGQVIEQSKFSQGGKEKKKKKPHH